MASQDAKTHVEQLVDDCRKGRPLPLFSDFLMRTCSPSPQGLLVSIIFGVSSQTVDVYDVQSHQADPFHESRLFWAWATGVSLEQTVLPGRNRLGLFAFGPDGYRYLSRRRTEIESLLNADGRPVDDYNPAQLAQVFLDALANQGPYTHALISSPAQLSQKLPVPGFGAAGYRLNEPEWERWRNVVAAPACTGDEHRGWALDCYTLYGWMHDKRTLCRIRYRIRCAPGSYRRRPTGFRLEERIETLSERLFHETPAVRY
jgi:hypothetical protein